MTKVTDMSKLKAECEMIEKLNRKVVDWYTLKYPQIISNNPNKNSLRAIACLSSQVLLPLEHQFGSLEVTYGFTSARLLKEIRKTSPTGIAPDLDQHAAHELNSRGAYFCERLGAACDFMINRYAGRMNEVAQWITLNLSFDRLYFYGPDRPIHVSVGPDMRQFIQIMKTAKSGRRYPGQKGTKITFNSISG